MGLGVAIVAIVSAALEWNRAQQLGESAISRIDELKSQLEQANEDLKEESVTLNQKLDKLQKTFESQATAMEKLTGRLNDTEDNLSEKTKLADELQEEYDALFAKSEKLEKEITTLNQQLDELQNKFDSQATTIEKLTGQLKINKDNLSKKTRFMKKLEEKHDSLRVLKEILGTYSTELEQQLAEARGLGTGKKSSNIQKEVLKTEETFLANMNKLKDLLKKWRTADSITESQLTFLSKGLDGVIDYTDNFLDREVEAYYDIKFMKKYYASLTTMVMNLKSVDELLKKLDVKELPEARRLFAGPTQRVGRHRMLFEELLKTSPEQKALKELKTLADWVNTSQRCNEELVEIQELLGVVVKDRGNGKQTNLVDSAQNLVSIKAKDPGWIEYWFGKPKDLNVALLALVDKLSHAVNIIEDKQILKQIEACAVCLGGIIPNDNNNEESPTELLLKLVKDKITQCG